MEPLTLLGTIFGVWLNLMFPGVILIVLLAAVLGFTAFRTLRRAFDLWKKETLELQGIEAIPIMPTQKDNNINNDVNNINNDVQEILNRESKFPFPYFLSLLLIWAVLSTLIMLRGGDSLHQSIIGVKCGTWQYFLILGCTIFFLVFATGVAMLYTNRLHKKKIAIGYKFLPCDLEWTEKNLVLWPLTSVLVGLAAGFVGIAGGVSEEEKREDNNAFKQIFFLKKN